MRANSTSLYGVGSLLLSLACSAHDTRPPPGSDAAAGAAGEVVGQRGTPETEGGGAGRSRGDSGGGGESDMHTLAGTAGTGAADDAGTDAGKGGAPFAQSGEGGRSEAGASAGGNSGEGGANASGDTGEAGGAGAAGAPPSRVTAEQRALCESICAKEPLTNGFAGAATAPCPNNESCADRVCATADLVATPTEVCMDAFTALLRCWDSLPDDEFECGQHGLVQEGITWYGECPNEDAMMSAVCRQAGRSSRGTRGSGPPTSRTAPAP